MVISFGNAMIATKGWLSLASISTIHGETVKIDPKSLDPNTEVMCF
jgi:hypothetical protein